MIESSAPLQANSPILIAGLLLPSDDSELIQQSLDEMQFLAQTLQYKVVDAVLQSRPQIEPGYYFGKGKLTEFKERIEAECIAALIVNGTLSPKQTTNLEKLLGCSVIDRTQLILMIFAETAKTHEAKLQVQLAQLQYMLPRLSGLWEHLDRERGGISASRGTGEKQIEKDRQWIRQRIAQLKKELAHIDRERDTQKKRRDQCLNVSLVGYTNAGKSTLMNALTHTRLEAEDKLFATLDSTTRQLDSKQRPQILMSDTVGFIQDLPHELVASFRSTLGVVRDADLLVHVVDVSGPYESQIETTLEVLEEIQAQYVPRLLVFNKIDRLENKASLLLMRKKYPDAVFVSAHSGKIEELQQRIIQFFEQRMERSELCLDYQSTHQLAQIYEWSRVDQIDYQEDGIHLTVMTMPQQLQRLRAYLGDHAFLRESP